MGSATARCGRVAVAPDVCAVCGEPWQSVTETVGDRLRVPDVREL